MHGATPVVIKSFKHTVSVLDVKNMYIPTACYYFLRVLKFYNSADLHQNPKFNTRKNMDQHHTHTRV